MLRLESELSRLDRERNYHIRGCLRTCDRGLKVEESRLKRLEHIIRREEGHFTQKLGKQVMC